ncbi:hypothetical protein F6V30_14535 [Oryzomonas sagensis]|uniref:Uncharacterized protein n=1 Tax=Oryzomonas sagensis TaxID=2603857 RepID=A0ABQ6TLW6_9BACT|nr:hypothetical protein [Oryzomonas sagensis]KAB0669048.1 hypothetical protein F6V30_14535 [Oryzomonas sagensis]
MSNLDHYKQAFGSVGWFIPPYVTVGFLSILSKRIADNGHSLDQQELEAFLALIYSADNVAAMVTERYPVTPYIQDYKKIISEAVQAHFTGLDHIAVSGLIPVIEGAGKKLADDRSVSFVSIRSLFNNLAGDCKRDAIENKIGAVDGVVCMMDSFAEFAEKHLYVHSENYPLADKTNRHGILHGAYSDHDYGRPLNFYKAIAAIDFLCFVSAFRAPISWFAPSPTDESKLLATYYCTCALLGKNKPTFS